MTTALRKELDRRFGSELGFNPHGQPNFRWVHTTEMFFYINHGSDWSLENGLMIWGKKFEAKPWSKRYGQCWILAKWNHYSREEWYALVGTKMPYPTQGDWVPCENIRLGPDYPEHPPEPNMDSTMDAISAILFHRNMDKRDFLEDPKRAHDLVVKGLVDKIGDELDDMIPAFGKEPGVHSGSTEFLN